MFRILALGLVISTSLVGTQVDFISTFPVEKHAPRLQMAKQTGFNIRYFNWDFHKYYQLMYSKQAAKINKIIFMSADIPFLNEFFMVPKKKRIAFYWEPHTSIENDAYWNKIYTFNDDVIDNVTVFKFYYPVMHEMVCPIPNFENKKLCVMVSRAATRERNQIIRFFETKPKNDFELFGYQPVIPSSRYCGSIPGHEFGSEKAQLMKQYRFAVCFENSFINGYITEKLFSCFEAGCVPIYLGAPNVTQYIPKGCFIDYRDFKTDEELYQFIKNMTKPDYDLYIENIRKFLVSPEAKLFSSENFNKTVYEAVTK